MALNIAPEQAIRYLTADEVYVIVIADGDRVWNVVSTDLTQRTYSEKATIVPPAMCADRPTLKVDAA